MRVSISLHVFVFMTMTVDAISSFAGDLTKASKGIYYSGTRGCDDASEPATLIFDGVNVHNTKTACRTINTGEDKYLNTCSFASQAKSKPQMSDIDADPYKYDIEAVIKVTSPTSLTFNDQVFTFCKAE